MVNKRQKSRKEELRVIVEDGNIKYYFISSFHKGLALVLNMP